MIPFFFIGSRRSGTTMLRYVLNAHPRIYCSYESGVMWMLHHIYLGGSVESARKETSHWAHTKLTFKYVGHILKRYERTDKSVTAARNAFFDSMSTIREKRALLDKKGASDYIAMGEKNPSEYSYPDINEFIRKVHPDLKFVHIVRHPMAFVYSIVAHAKDPLEKSRSPSFNDDIKLLTERWVKNERNALLVSKTAPTCTIRYEDLCDNPRMWVSHLYSFLSSKSSAKTVLAGASIVGRNSNSKYDLSVPIMVDGLRDLMERYQYAN